MTAHLDLARRDGCRPAILLLEETVPRELGSRPRFLVDQFDLRWRRVVEYPLLGLVRGRYTIGPLTVRTTDPFGLAQLDRRFVATTRGDGHARVVPLPTIRTLRGSGQTGEARPHRIGLVGQDDVLVREYRQGDDVRRIHWRSTARLRRAHGAPRGAGLGSQRHLFLDTRPGAHAGRGMHNSFEWAVSAAASIGIHFLDDGFSIEIYEADGPLRISGSMGQHSSASAELVISRLTDLGPRHPSLHYAVESAAIDRAGQLVIAVMGRMTAADANALLRLRRNRAQGLAIMLDVDTFADQPGSDQQRAQHELAAEILRDNQWRVIEVPRGMGVAEAWAALEQMSGGLMRRHRPERDRGDRLGRAGLPDVRPLTADGGFLSLELAADRLIGGIGIALRRSGRRRHGARRPRALVLAAVLPRAQPGHAGARRAAGSQQYAALWAAGIEHMRTQASPMDPNDGVRLIFVTVVGVIMIMTELLVSGVGRPAWALAPPATLFLVPALGLGTDTGIVNFLLIAIGYLAILVAEGLNTDRPLDARAVPRLGRRIRHGVAGGLAGGRRISPGRLWSSPSCSASCCPRCRCPGSVSAAGRATDRCS